jgi:small-conductance mechanosensitive channel
VITFAVAFSIALTFTLGTVLENFVSGLIVQVDREILEGDRIMIKEFEGKLLS